jgi:hypothetical protein
MPISKALALPAAAFLRNIISIVGYWLLYEKIDWSQIQILFNGCFHALNAIPVRVYGNMPKFITATFMLFGIYIKYKLLKAM